jgi:BNR repeat protein
MSSRRGFLEQSAAALAVLSSFVMAEKQTKKNVSQDPGAAGVVEGFTRAERGKDPTALLSTGTRDGLQSLSNLGSMAYSFVRKDGSLGFLSFEGDRAISRDGGRTFHYLPKLELPMPPPEAVKREQRLMGGPLAYNGPVGLIKMRDGILGMSWAQCYSLEGNHDVVNMYFRTSADDGETWSKDVLMNPGRDKGVPLEDTLRQLSSGRLIQPVRWVFWGGNHLRKTSMCRVDGKEVGFEGHGHHPEFDLCYCYYSDDSGKTWSRSHAEIIGFFQDGWGNFLDLDEPVLDELPDGKLLMLMRTMVGRLFKSFSEDNGNTWSLPSPTPLAADNAPCAMRRIPSTGDLLCVWNHLSNDEIRRGMRRSRLSSAITRDGETWSHFRSIEWHPCVPERSGYIQPEEKIQCTRSLAHIGELPEGWGTSAYATLGFNGNQVIVSYDHTVNALRTGKMASRQKHRILPVSWFYERA